MLVVWLVATLAECLELTTEIEKVAQKVDKMVVQTVFSKELLLV
jgi:hypothetical protein